MMICDKCGKAIPTGEARTYHFPKGFELVLCKACATEGLERTVRKEEKAKLDAEQRDLIDKAIAFLNKFADTGEPAYIILVNMVVREILREEFYRSRRR